MAKSHAQPLFLSLKLLLVCMEHYENVAIILVILLVHVCTLPHQPAGPTWGGLSESVELGKRTAATQLAACPTYLSHSTLRELTAWQSVLGWKQLSSGNHTLSNLFVSRWTSLSTRKIVRFRMSNFLRMGKVVGCLTLCKRSKAKALCRC